MSSPLPVSSAAIDRENPWPGLASFTEESREFFFGREKETEELVRLVRRNTLTVLFGQSGLGKSSLLQAGLFPILREGDYLPLYLRLDHDEAAAALAEQVKAALTTEFAAEKADAPGFSADETLWEYFHRKDVDVWSAKNRLLTPVLAFDQFEEIFTLGRTDEARRERSRTFLAELACLVENRPPAAVREKLDAGTLDPLRFNFDKPSCRVILTLREDFLPDLEGLKRELPALVHSRLRLQRLSGAQAVEIVTRPAPRLLAEGVAERIVEFVAGGGGEDGARLAEREVEPALLSVICRELNERRRGLGQAQISADLVSGNRQEILTNFYERSVADLPEAMHHFVEDHLLTKSGFRDSLALETALGLPGVTRVFVDVLVTRRLLRIEDRGGVQRVELTHDVLAGVVQARRDTRRQRAELAVAKRRTRRALVWLSVAAAATALAIVGAIKGARAQRQAEAAQREQIVLSARTDLDLALQLQEEGRHADSLAYMVRAAEKDPSNLSLTPRLLSALTTHAFSLPDAPPLVLPSPAIDARASSDGKRMYVQGRDRVLRIVRLDTWAVEKELQFAAPVVPHSWALAERDADILAVELANGTLLVCDAATGRPRLPPIERPNRIPAPPSAGERLGLAPDGRYLSTGDGVSTWVWDTQTGRMNTTIKNSKINEVGGYQVVGDDGWVFRFPGTNNMVLVSAATGKTVTPKLGAGQNLTSFGKFQGVRLSLDGKRAVALYQRGARAFNTETGEILARSNSLNTEALQVMFSPDRLRYVLATRDWEALLVETDTGRTVRTLKHRGLVTDIQFSADGRTLLTRSSDGVARTWDGLTGAVLAEPLGEQKEAMPALLTRDGAHVIFFSEHGEAQRLRVGRGGARSMGLGRTSVSGVLAGFMQSAPGRVLWMNKDGALSFEAKSAGAVKKVFTFPYPLVSADAIRTKIANWSREGWFADDEYFLTYSDARGWAGWRWRSGNPTLEVMPMDRSRAYLGHLLTNEDHTIAFSTATPRKSVVCWDPRTGQQLPPFTHELEMSCLISREPFSPDGRKVMFQTADGVVRIFDVATRREAAALERIDDGTEADQMAAFSRDSRRIFSGSAGGQVRVWDAETGKLLRATPGHRHEIAGLVVASSGRHFATWSTAGTARIWDAATGAPVGEPLRHQRGLRLAAFSPDGTRLAVAGDGRIVMIWDVRTGEPVAEPVKFGRSSEYPAASGLTYSPDGQFLLLRTAALPSPNSSYRLFSVPPQSAAGVPPWLLRLATLCAGQRVTMDGDVEPLETWSEEAAAVQQVLARLPADDEVANWGRWILRDPATRSIAPGFDATDADVAKLLAALSVGGDEAVID